jgi:hypothetical protein
MSNPRYSLRKISFPASPSTFEDILSSVSYLAYLLPYSTTLSLYDSITRTFIPGEKVLESELLISDVASPNYNKNIIDTYITKDIFSKIPLTMTTTIEIPGASMSPSTFNMTTVGTIIPDRLTPGGRYDIPVQPSFLRDGFLYQLSRYSSNGDGEIPVLYEYDLGAPEALPATYDVTWDFVGDWAATISNVVIDSFGNINAIKKYTNEITPANTDYYLTGYNNLTSTLDITREGSTAILLNSPTVLSFKNTLIDSDDNIYLCALEGLYKIVAGVLTLIATPETNFIAAEYNATTNTILVYDELGTYKIYSTTGTLLNSITTMNTIGPNEFATATEAAMVQYVAQDGPPDFIVSAYLDDTSNINVPTNGNNVLAGFVDGTETECQLSDYFSMVIKYDSNEPDLYFIDRLTN